MAKLLGFDVQKFLVTFLTTIVIIMIVNRVDFLKKLVLGG